MTATQKIKDSPRSGVNPLILYTLPIDLPDFKYILTDVNYDRLGYLLKT